MKQFISKVKNLSQKAAEIKAAMQQLPPKVAEVREAVAATTGQLQQLKSEIQFSVADLKADQEESLSEALQEINSSADVFAKAGFELSGVDLEISPVQRILVHLKKIEDVHVSMLRSLVQANQHRRTTRAILSSLLQAKQMAETVELQDLDYSEVAVGVGPVPSVRLCWRPEETEPEIAPSVPAISISTPAATVAAAPAVFGQSSFFEKRSVPAAPASSVAVHAAPATEETVEQAIQSQPASESTQAKPPDVTTDPLARFKKMPTWAMHKK